MDRRRAAGLLGVDVAATPEQVARAYRRRAGEYHPDRGGDPDDFRRLREARDVLTARGAMRAPAAPVRVVRRSLLTRLLDGLTGLVPRSWRHRRGRDLE